MATPKITLSAGISPSEGKIGTYLIKLDTPAPAGGLTVNFNTLGSTATFGTDYTFSQGSNLTAVTAHSFTVAAGATVATLNLAAAVDFVTDPKETVVVSLAAGMGYSVSKTIPTFTEHTVAVGDKPRSVISADFNGDGNADLATANYDGKSISVRLGNGQGGFSGATEVALGYSIIEVISADFNNDGKADLATVAFSENGDSILVRLGDGQGGFTGTTQVAVGNYSYTIISADFNGDGNADLATNSDRSILVRLGDGKGGFSWTPKVAVGIRPSSIVSADFNGDGNADLASANTAESSVSIRLGDGKGGFSRTTELEENYPHSVINADFNGDGKADLAITAGGSAVSVRLSDGKGGFSGGTMVAMGISSKSIFSADFNGDGNADLATSDSDNNVSIRLGNGKGGFSGSTILTLPHSPNRYIFTNTSADFNGDGKADLAIVNPLDDSVSVLLNTGNVSKAVLTITDNTPNHAPTGRVTISDRTPETRQKLAVTDTLADADGLGTITYSWLANGLQVGTGNSYTVTDQDVGKILKVTASYTDGFGKLENASSAGTNAVVFANLTLNGTDGDDVLNGGGGNDTLNGYAGNDTLNGNDGKDTLIGGTGDDSLDGGAGDDFLAGTVGNDLAKGGNGNDIINGGEGKDELIGDKGDDTLNGGLGDDILLGFAGNDIQKGGDGNDVLGGIAGNNTLEGEMGNDTLIAGGGYNILTGGEGQDSFLFIATSHSSISDFVVADDTIKLENKFFTQLTATGVLATAYFVTGASAVDGNDYIVYNSGTGTLSYDADGNGSGAAVQIAVLGATIHPALANTDFMVV